MQEEFYKSVCQTPAKPPIDPIQSGQAGKSPPSRAHTIPDDGLPAAHSPSALWHSIDDPRAA
eukprot:1161638-Pelagomonas_calceolata.AAC.5